jgi:beta-galactosidase
LTEQNNGDKRPIFFVEYSHAMGNSNGNMKEFWDIFRSTPRIIGGAIWEFKDQGLLKRDSSGKAYYAYGGDFGERYFDNFTIKGVVASDGRPKAAMYECKRIFQGPETELVDASKGTIKITNRQAVKSLCDYNVNLVVRKDGEVVVNKSLPCINLAAGKDTIISLASHLPQFASGSEYLTDIHFSLARDEAWASKGFEVASNQFALTGLAKGKIDRKKNQPVGVVEETNFISIKGKDFEVSIDKTNGGLASYRWKNKEQLFSPLLPHFKRPLTDNDRRGWKPNRKLNQWYEAKMRVLKVSASAVGKKIEEGVDVLVNGSIIKDSAEIEIRYHISGNGIIQVDYLLKAHPALPNIPKVGMQCGIERSYENISWYGKGLMENYIDRNYGFDAAIYSQGIFDFMEPYAVPQENGNRTDVRWMSLSNKKNEGLLIVADSLLSMSAWPYTEENIEKAKHTIDLKDAGYITLNIDLMQMGVGGNDSWSDVAAPLEKYQIPAGTYQYRYYLIHKNENPRSKNQKKKSK